MVKAPEINQITPRLFNADGVGNQVVEIWKTLTSLGFKSRVITQEWDPQFGAFCVKPERYKDGSDKISLFHLCVGSTISDFSLGLKDRVIPYYHNVTPARFYARYNPTYAAYLDMGRAQLIQHAVAPYALAASEYNRVEMLEAGYRQVDVLPYIIGNDRLLADPNSRAERSIVERLGKDRTTWLFVGRVAPNKRQDRIILAFNYYHRLINPRSRLLLVGGADLSAPGYGDMLRAMTRDLGLAGAVEFCGSVSPEAGLAAYYKAADLFVCLSEHEGFCIPIVEAMLFDIPVLALNQTGVPYTLDTAGILVNHSRSDLVAEMAHLLLADAPFHDRVIQRQRLRRTEFGPDAARAILRETIHQLAASSQAANRLTL